MHFYVFQFFKPVYDHAFINFPTTHILDINECLSNPCFNDGTCDNGRNLYTCDCTGTGYSGPQCDVIIEGNIGQNKMVYEIILQFLLIYHINLKSFLKFYYNIIFKKIFITVPCDSAPCVNGGVCTHIGTGFLCNCTNTGYTGTQCEIGSLETM